MFFWWCSVLSLFKSSLCETWEWLFFPFFFYFNRLNIFVLCSSNNTFPVVLLKAELMVFKNNTCASCLVMLIMCSGCKCCLLGSCMAKKKAEFTAKVACWEAKMPVDLALRNNGWWWLSPSWFSFLLLDPAEKVPFFFFFLLIEYFSHSSKYKSLLMRQLRLGFHFFYVALQASFN